MTQNCASPLGKCPVCLIISLALVKGEKYTSNGSVDYEISAEW